jgi:hypothetical protein
VGAARGVYSLALQKKEIKMRKEGSGVVDVVLHFRKLHTYVQLAEGIKDESIHGWTHPCECDPWRAFGAPTERNGRSAPADSFTLGLDPTCRCPITEHLRPTRAASVRQQCAPSPRRRATHRMRIWFVPETRSVSAWFHLRRKHNKWFARLTSLVRRFLLR